jgi:hypothetical protein
MSEEDGDHELQRKKKRSIRQVYASATTVENFLNVKKRRNHKNVLKKNMIPNFDLVEVIKDREERYKDLSAEFNGEKFDNEDFKKYFVQRNKGWFRENLRLIFTPSTLKK